MLFHISSEKLFHIISHCFTLVHSGNQALLLKDTMELRVKNFNIFGIHWKAWHLGGGGVTKIQYRERIA